MFLLDSVLETMDVEQSEFKRKIKQWLKLQGLSYNWLAEQCGVSEITVRNWMSQRNIPTLRRQLLERVMVQMPLQNAGASETPGVSVNAGFTLTVQLAEDIYTRLLARAETENTSVEQLVAGAITNLAGQPASPALRSRKIILPRTEEEGS